MRKPIKSPPHSNPRLKAATAMSRRQFLQHAARWVGAGVAVSTPGWAMPPLKRRAAIMGHTGQGDYGHGLDVIFNGRGHIEVVAVADPDPAGRARAAQRSQAQRQYADYREMLERESPHLVSVAPRWTRQHHAMALAALNAGAHVLLEKPITQTLAEADELLAVARRRGLKIAVAHQMRLAPSVRFLQQQLAGGLIGELVEMRAWGKQDHRAGGEDLVVLGVHLFDLMRLFAGDAAGCTAQVWQDGRRVTLADVRAATEDIGPVIGDEVRAQFEFAGGVRASFVSHTRLREVSGPWGMELIGRQGAVRILTDLWPQVFLCASGRWKPEGKTDHWRPIPGDPGLIAPAEDKTVDAANARVVDDWLEAIARNREPECSGYAGMKALEMAHAVFTAGVSQTRVTLPLAARQHPLRAGT